MRSREGRSRIGPSAVLLALAFGFACGEAADAPADAATPGDGALPLDFDGVPIGGGGAVGSDAAPDAQASGGVADADLAPRDATSDAVPPADAEPSFDAVPLADAAPRADAAPPAEVCPPTPDPRPDVALRVDGRVARVRAFESAHLGRPRDLTFYLPDPARAAPDARVAVLYAHDGQNLFFDDEAFGGRSWGVPAALDALVASGAVPPVLVVGVHNTADRIAEYTPSVDPDLGLGGDADAYGRFLVEELKPFVDARFQTSCDRTQTGLMGSSLGGLVSLHLRRRYPEVFGRVGAISPSLWWNRGEAQGWAGALGAELRPGERLWIDMGDEEGEAAEDADADGRRGTLERARALAEATSAATAGGAVLYLEAPAARHDEASWRARLPDILRGLFGTLPTAEALDRLEARSFRPTVPRGGHAGFSVDAVYLQGGRRTLLFNELVLESGVPGLVWGADGRLQGGDGAAVGEVEVRALGREVRAPVQVGPETAVRFEVTAPAGVEAPIYLSGSLGTLGPWAADAARTEPTGDGRARVVIAAPPGRLEYKYTLGTWETVERNAAGADTPNRVVDVGGPGAPRVDRVERFGER